MTKRQLIEQIVTLNRSAPAAFLAGFDDAELDEYLRHLRVLGKPRLRGDAGRYAKYFAPPVSRPGDTETAGCSAADLPSDSPDSDPTGQAERAALLGDRPVEPPGDNPADLQTPARVRVVEDPQPGRPSLALHPFPSWRADPTEDDDPVEGARRADPTDRTGEMNPTDEIDETDEMDEIGGDQQTIEEWSQASEQEDPHLAEDRSSERADDEELDPANDDAVQPGEDPAPEPADEAPSEPRSSPRLPGPSPAANAADDQSDETPSYLF